MRNEITRILSQKNEATAKDIAFSAGLELGDVLKELAAMHRDAEVEREKRKGNEYTYWLANAQPALPDTPAASEEKPAAAAEAVEAAAPVVDPNFQQQMDSFVGLIEDLTGKESEATAEIPVTAVHVDTELENAVNYISKALPQGVSIGIFSDGSIDLVDSATNHSYTPSAAELSDCLQCFTKLQRYQVPA